MSAINARFLPVAFALLLGNSPALAQAPANLAGTWRLNVEASDASGSGGDPDVNVGRRGGFGIPARQPMGGFGSPGPMAPPVAIDPELRKQHMDVLREVLQPVRRFTIAQDAAAVSFTYDDGRTVRYRTDGKAEKHQAINGVVETETRWKKGKLVRETNLDDGMTVEETFSVDPSRVLVVHVETSGGPGRRKPLRRVYDPVEELP